MFFRRRPRPPEPAEPPPADDPSSPAGSTGDVEAGRRDAASDEGRSADEGLEDGGPEAIALEITDTLDLHFFPPREVQDLVRTWLDEAYGAGFRELRIIHGKGRGVQRRMVRAVLERDPRVVDFGDARDRSSWGATRVTLR